jgi:hypothetical protein
MSKRASCNPEHFQEKWHPVFRPKTRQRRNASLCVGLLATAIMLGTSCATFAADDCLAGPNRAPGPGGHWYYHFDRASDRRCWYLVEPAAQAPTAQAAQPAAEPTPPPPQPTFGSFFSSLGFTASTAQPNSTGDVRLVQPAPADETDVAPPARHPRMVLASKPHRTAHLRPPAEHADERPSPQLNQAERDALFQEFLRWRGNQ